jgi:hypothetical protein
MDFSTVLEFLKRQLDQPSGVVAENVTLQDVQLQRTGYRSFWDVAFSIVEQISRRLRPLFQVLSESGDGAQERSRPPRSTLSLSSLRVDLSQQACPASVG